MTVSTTFPIIMARVCPVALRTPLGAFDQHSALNNVHPSHGCLQKNKLAHVLWMLAGLLGWLRAATIRNRDTSAHAAHNLLLTLLFVHRDCNA